MDPTDKADSEVRGLDRYAPDPLTKGLWVATVTFPFAAGLGVYGALGVGYESLLDDRTLIACLVTAIVFAVFLLFLSVQYAHLVESKRHRVLVHRVGKVQDAPTLGAWLQAAPAAAWLTLLCVLIGCFAIGRWV